VLIPGRFGSTGHQAGNARVLEQAGAAVVIDQDALAELAPTVQRLLPDVGLLAEMTTACGAIAKPEAALTIAGAMIEAAV
jgi:UDP-N-acetylglucosamine:LPS N-acetylglucosamine transferase